MSESSQTKRSYEPMPVNYPHHDTGLIETVKVYRPQSKFLLGLAFSSEGLDQTAKTMLIGLGMVCESIHWAAIIVASAIQGQQKAGGEEGTRVRQAVNPITGEVMGEDEVPTPERTAKLKKIAAAAREVS
jgi:hypothetical protein